MKRISYAVGFFLLFAILLLFVGCPKDSALPKDASSSSGSGGTSSSKYIVFHFLQKVTGGDEYDSPDVEFDVLVRGEPALADVQKTYTGFTASNLSVKDDDIYVYYNRNTITYTFKSGSSIAFSVGTTSKTVSGLYGAACTVPAECTATDYYVNGWKVQNETVTVPQTFEATDKTFDAMWVPNGFVLIPATTFMMGCSAESGSNPIHEVTLTRSYYICDHEVTQKEYTEYWMGSFTHGVGDNYPAHNINWYATLAYCNKRSLAEGLTPCYSINGSPDTNDWGADWSIVDCDFSANGYRLPTEAEWEYAARAGDTTTASVVYSGTPLSTQRGYYAWLYDTNDYTTHVVKGKRPNVYGLYDMSGNVSEWCWDWLNVYPSGSVTDPTGGTKPNPAERVTRGGDYVDSDYEDCTVTCRTGEDPDRNWLDNGFRVVRTAE